MEVQDVVVFWMLGLLMVALLYLESFGPEALVGYESIIAQYRAPEIYFEFADERQHLSPDNETVSYEREMTRGLVGEGANATHVIDVSYIEGFEGFTSVPYDDTKLKTILVWNNGYGIPAEGLTDGDRTELARHGCPQPNCVVVSNRTLMPIQDYDAVILHFRASKQKDIPKVRSPKQRYIFKEIEPASYIYQDITVYNGVFNWTYTYRLDSDIPDPYGRVAPMTALDRTAAAAAPEQRVLKKTKMAAWFVSNCRAHSGRDSVVKVMQLFLKVDVYGKCGPLKCPLGDGSRNSCYEMLEEDYKFYLSFENSLCKDYVTEKLFTVLKYRVVPVVYGASNYTKIAPPHSFINAMDFPTVKKLAEYLLYLDGNETAYNEYMNWRSDYKVLDGYVTSLEHMCHLCHKLHSDTSYKVYDDLDTWFVYDSRCKTLKQKIKKIFFGYGLG